MVSHITIQKVIINRHIPNINLGRYGADAAGGCSYLPTRTPEVACRLGWVPTFPRPRSKRIGPRPGGQAPPRGHCYFFQTKIIISHPSVRTGMAKNTFFIRASVNGGNAGAFAQEEIDLGSYTNLGSSKPEVLRIHNVTVAMTDSAGNIPQMTTDTADSCGWQITTQSQSALVLLTDDSFVSGGRGSFRNPDGSTHAPTQTFGEQVLAQDFSAGYLVAVPSLYLGGIGGNNFTEDVYFSVMLECSTESMTKASAVSLAVSQQ